ncbi:myb family transcription factor PHL8-like [Ipomoea triloba]|uniref:myb family transcription factor PHL8-like n=1 Tax=Ipomoea triloba TaxID=35885 RepID=UPI00125D7E94|nr:myb family transcription factor PHL8-like [Ipomoea triloba]
MECIQYRHSMVDDQSSSIELIFVTSLDEHHNRSYENGLYENQAYGFKLCEKSKDPLSEWSACLHHRFSNVVERLGGQKDENQAYGVTLCDKWKQPQSEWSVCFHHRFLNVVERLGGKKGATPKAILELMNEKDLTLNQVRNHFQIGVEGKNNDAPDNLMMSSDENPTRAIFLGKNLCETVSL